MSQITSEIERQKYLTLFYNVVRKVENIKGVIFITYSIFYLNFTNSTRYLELTLYFGLTVKGILTNSYVCLVGVFFFGGGSHLCKNYRNMLVQIFAIFGIIVKI